MTWKASLLGAFFANLQCFWGELVWNSCLEFSFETSGGWHVLKLSISRPVKNMSITSQLHSSRKVVRAQWNCCSLLFKSTAIWSIPGFAHSDIVSSVFPALFQETALGQLFVIKPSLQKTRWETPWSIWMGHQSRSNSGPNTSLLSIHPHRAPWSDWGSTSQLLTKTY